METQIKTQKKEYQKPNITKVKLIPEEAVLAVCKDGAAGLICQPDTCSFLPTS